MDNPKELFADLDRYGANPENWPASRRQALSEASAKDADFARALSEMERLEASLREALIVPAAAPSYAQRIAATASLRAKAHAQKKIARWTFAVGSGWAMAAALAGLVYGQLLSASDPDMLTFAEVALGATSLITGN